MKIVSFKIIGDKTYMGAAKDSETIESVTERLARVFKVDPSQIIILELE